MTDKLDEIPSGFNPDSAAAEMAATPKQVSEDALKVAPELTPEGAEPGTGTGDTTGPLSPDRIKNHKHAKTNASVVVIILSFVCAFALTKLVDNQGTINDYKFTEPESQNIEQAFELWFNSFEEDFVLPTVMVPITALGATVWGKYEQAAAAAKQRKPAPPNEVTASTSLSYQANTETERSRSYHQPIPSQVMAPLQHPVPPAAPPPASTTLSPPLALSAVEGKTNKGGRPKGATDSKPRKKRSTKTARA